MGLMKASFKLVKLAVLDPGLPGPGASFQQSTTASHQLPPMGQLRAGLAHYGPPPGLPHPPVQWRNAGNHKHAHPPVEPTSSSDKKKKKVKKEDVDEPKPKAKAKAKAKSKPTASATWYDLMEKYNTWMLKTANKKPTGDAERLQIYTDILDAEAGILEKCSNGDIQDSDFDPAASDNDGDNEADIDDTCSHISIESDNDTPKPVHDSRLKLPFLQKASEENLRQTNATEVLSSISTALDPHVMHEWDEAHASYNFQIQQISFYQSENCTLMQQNMELNKKLQEERRRADAATNELNMLRLLEGLATMIMTVMAHLIISICIHLLLAATLIIPVHLIAVSVHGPLEFIIPLHLITVSVYALPNTIVLTLQDQHHLLLFVE
ncbi:hypothetical protein BT96DRAFT_1042367 [Gymnopus androsaceus JB14]|uniref:Uncharacterized protein n=1 Tax=Gymnopus androsaceus JB14 TaxID=1447944 RepID=A0A6A4I9Z4_9AGAR|nr:hypothetical protein BT96DRAFT_1042367 [Gymnopus androsaceus JB14]